MATFAGYLFHSPVIAKSGIEITAPHELAPWGGWLASEQISGAKNDTQPIDEPANSKAGLIGDMFGFADWYDRIHVSPLAIDVGSVVSLQETVITVWNAYVTSKTLQSILASNAEGISLIQPGTPPLVYPPLKQNFYTVRVSTDGPATIDAAYAFNFQDSETLITTIVGSRITPWLWRPDWANPMLERLEWLTDTKTAYDGTEQRIQLREYPRRAFEFSILVSGRARRLLDSAIYGWGAREWALPVWPDGTLLESSLSVGATSIPVDTANRDYHTGGLVMLLSENDLTYEVAEIDTVSASSISLARPLTLAWPAGDTIVYPVRAARLKSRHGFKRFDFDSLYGTVQMEVNDSNAWPEESGGTTYRGYPVLGEKPNWIEDIDQEFIRKLAELDFATGDRAYRDESDAPEIIQSHRWLIDGRAALGAFRSWLYSRAGKFGAIWVPTWSDDIKIVATVGPTATQIDIENIDYTKRIAAGVARNDLRIEMIDGSIYFARIIGAAEVSTAIERLTIEAAIGVEIVPANVRVVSYLALMRLDSDGVELAWFTGDIAECAHPMRAIKHDV